MGSIVTHPYSLEQAPALSDARAAAVMGIALANARMRLADSLELALTAGAQFDAARAVTLIVVGKAAEMQPDLTVTQLFNLLTDGRR